MSAPPASREPRTGAQVADLVVTIVLLVALWLLAWVFSIWGLFLSMLSDGCFGDCDSGVIMAGVVVATVAPWLIAIAATAWAIVRLVRRRVAWWLPLIAACLVVLAFYAGGAIAMLGVPD